MTQPNETGQSKQTTAATKTSKQTAGQGAKKASQSGSLWIVVVILVLAGVFVTGHLARRAGDAPRPVASADEESAPGVDAESVIELDSGSGAAAPALVITSDIRDADVYLNGKRVGKTPHKATPLTAGRYQVKVMKEGYETFEESVEVSSPDDTVRADLTPAAVAFRVESNVSGASVELDGQPWGSTPLATAELAPGTYELVVRAAGYKSHSETVEYTGGARDIRVDLVESSSTVVLDEAVAVKHKHRIRGGCEGLLRASSEGIQFETEHKDAFTVSFSRLERIRFEKDELSLKVQGGKSYNFVERNDDEDALALFHERVDEARVQLAESN